MAVVAEEEPAEQVAAGMRDGGYRTHRALVSARMRRLGRADAPAAHEQLGDGASEFHRLVEVEEDRIGCGGQPVPVPRLGADQVRVGLGRRARPDPQRKQDEGEDSQPTGGSVTHGAGASRAWCVCGSYPGPPAPFRLRGPWLVA